MIAADLSDLQGIPKKSHTTYSVPETAALRIHIRLFNPS